MRDLIILGLILGSGLGNFVDEVEDAQAVDYGDIPGYITEAEPSPRRITGQCVGRLLDPIAGERYHHPLQSNAF